MIVNEMLCWEEMLFHDLCHGVSGTVVLSLIAL